MSDFNAPKDLPDNYDAYGNWISGWVFGLGGQSGSHQCGAMPFRYGESGINAQNVLRGEDWAFLYSVCLQKDLVSTALWPNYNPTFPILETGPTRRQLDNMYNFLYETQQARCFGTGLTLGADQGVVCQYSNIDSTLVSLLDGLMVIQSQQPPQGAGANVRLTMSRMKDFFRDTQKMKCTLADAGYRMSESRTTVYDYSEPVTIYGQPSDLDTSNITEIYCSQSYGSPTQMIRAMGQVVVPMYGYSSDGYGNRDEKYAVLVLGSQVQMTTSQNMTYQLRANVTITGQHIANVFAQVTGMNIRPPASQDYSSRCQIQFAGPKYLAVWPKWLIDYTWPEDS